MVSPTARRKAVRHLRSRHQLSESLHNSKGIGESNTQLGLSVYFAAKEAVRAARREAGLSDEFKLGFPASVNRVSRCLPSLLTMASSSARCRRRRRPSRRAARSRGSRFRESPGRRRPAP